MNEQERFWAEEYADEYIRGNSEFDYKKGADCWRTMLRSTSSIETVLECGSNIGRNISMLDEVLPSAEKSIIEISKPAFDIAVEKFNLRYAFNGSITDSSINDRFDLVYTMGVLIHIHPEQLLSNMKKMYDYSKRYVLIGEYFNRTPVSIEYRGQSDKLFKMDFGKYFIENFPVQLLDYGFFWGYLTDSAGFDDITWWLFEKVDR